MRVFLAGATGVIGVRLVPLLLAAGHEVAGMTRSQPEVVERLGAEPVVCDVYDLERLRRVVADFGPDVVLHELTDLPDARGDLEAWRPRNQRMRLEGTRNLLDAAAGAKVVAQSIAFPPYAREHDRLILDAGGVVLRFGVFHGPGTWNEDGPPEGVPAVHVDEAARRTVAALAAPPGTLLEVVA